MEKQVFDRDAGNLQSPDLGHPPEDNSAVNWARAEIENATG
jgi:hypothetical protein